jgi:L-fuculose-phosphate aldolase
MNKGFLTDDDLIVTDLDGDKMRGKGVPSSENRLHLETYRLRSDVNAVVHAHPPKCIAFSIAGVRIPEDVLPEVVLTLGCIPTTNYATPTTEETAHAIRGLIEKHNAIILDHHGTLTVGKNLVDAYNRLEKIEHAAEVILTAHILGGVRPLTSEQLAKIRNLNYGS